MTTDCIMHVYTKYLHESARTLDVDVRVCWMLVVSMGYGVWFFSKVIWFFSKDHTNVVDGYLMGKYFTPGAYL